MTDTDPASGRPTSSRWSARVLGRTHAYRFAVSPPAGRHWPPRGADTWNGAICGAAESWAAWAEDPEGPPPALVADAWAVLREGASATLEDVADGRATGRSARRC